MFFAVAIQHPHADDTHFGREPGFEIRSEMFASSPVAHAWEIFALITGAVVCLQRSVSLVGTWGHGGEEGREERRVILLKTLNSPLANPGIQRHTFLGKLGERKTEIRCICLRRIGSCCFLYDKSVLFKL